MDSDISLKTGLAMTPQATAVFVKSKHSIKKNVKCYNQAIIHIEYI